MPEDPNHQKILLVCSGPILIGQVVTAASDAISVAAEGGEVGAGSKVRWCVMEELKIPIQSNSSSLNCLRTHCSPGISTGYTPVRQPRQRSLAGMPMDSTSPSMLRYPSESA